MPKKQKTKRLSVPASRSLTPSSAPSFLPGTQITCVSMVVDQYGTAWWVDPESRTIKHADT